MSGYAYLIVTGTKFDPLKFLAEVRSGSLYIVRAPKLPTGNRVDGWRSDKVYIGSDLDYNLAIMNLVAMFQNNLAGVVKNFDALVSIQAVHKREPGGDPRGMFLSTQLIRTLAELGADLDFDAY
jgi:hypothetical protein